MKKSLFKAAMLFVASLPILFSACVLFPDVYCTNDEECPGTYVCFTSHQCVPKWWVAKLNSKSENTSVLPEKKGDALPCSQSCSLGQIRACYQAKAGCSQVGNDWKCKGICQTGQQKCILESVNSCPIWSNCQNEVLPETKEICDKKDNNCNGAVDEGCECEKGEIRDCFTGQEGCTRSGDTFTCITPCSSGKQTCGDDNKWKSDCLGEIKPTKEICDGLDNDCNGKIDDALSPPFCDKQLGVCAGVKKKCGLEKGWLACSGSEYGEKYEISETKCDNLDNDCDGKIDPGCVMTVAGTGKAGFSDGQALQAEFNSISGIVFDKQGNIYVGDAKNARIRKLLTTGKVETVAGSGTLGDKDGPALSAEFKSPVGLTIDLQGRVIFSDSELHKIKRYDPKANTVETIAGNGQEGDSLGSALTAQFNSPRGLAVNSKGEIFIADAQNNKIKKITTGGMVVLVTGTKTSGTQDGKASEAQFSLPSSLVFDSQGNLFITDASNNLIRKLDTKNIVTTVAGVPGGGYLDGPAISAKFRIPTGITIDQSGNLYISDFNNARIRKIDTQKNVTTIIGTGAFGYVDGPASKAQVGLVFALTISPNNELFFTESFNHVIRKYIRP